MAKIQWQQVIRYKWLRVFVLLHLQSIGLIKRHMQSAAASRSSTAGSITFLREHFCFIIHVSTVQNNTIKSSLTSYCVCENA
jgi:hypothetical protein